jgi:hypothetical protein
MPPESRECTSEAELVPVATVPSQVYDAEMLALRAAVLAMLLFCGGALLIQQTEPESTESYAVYSALIPEIQSLAQPRYVIANRTVPYARTKSSFPVEPENLITEEDFDRELQLARRTPAWLRIWKSQPCILAPATERDSYFSAMVDYLRSNESALPLEPRFNLPTPYELADVGNLDNDAKHEFAEKSGGYRVYELSAVGFNSDMTLAIVYVGFDCLMCGRWALHVLKKTDGKWKEIASGCNTMS